ncbi:hypothetical protein [Methanococcoides burtonii]|nr:hypothetical protein [Methanococcoides burtonii]
MLPRLELTPTRCIKTALQPLLDNIQIPINGYLNCKNLFASVLGMAT